MKIKLLFTFCMTMLLLFQLNAQSLLKLHGLQNNKVICTTMDSLDNLYMMHYDNLDTASIYKFDNASAKWSKFALLNERAVQFETKGSMHWLNGELVVTGFGQDFDTFANIIKVKGGKGTVIGTIEYSTPKIYSQAIQSVKCNNKLYYYGGIDSFLNLLAPVLVEYDGSSARSLTPPTFNSNSKLYTYNDTLFFATNNIVYIYLNNNWFTYYKTYSSSNLIHSMAKIGNKFYISERFGLIREIQNNSTVDSFYSLLERPKLVSVNGGIYYSNRSFSLQRTPFYSYKINKGEFNFREVIMDSLEFNFVTNNKRLYIYKRTPINVEGQNYGYLAEVNLIELKYNKMDSVFVRTFLDINKNGIFDGQDVYNRTTIIDEVSINYYNIDSGVYTLIKVYDNEALNLKPLKNFSQSNCYSIGFSGGISSNVYQSSKTIDFIDIPMVNKVGNTSNLYLNAYAFPTARLNEVVDLSFEVTNTECNSSSKNGTLYVNLDPNTEYIGSTPNYTSKNGNSFSFNFVNSSTSPFKVVMKVKYSNLKYKLNDIVKHTSSIIIDGDNDLSDNNDTIFQKMVYSYDPNIKTSIPEGKTYKNLNKIRYIIHFQNEGNGDAWKVRVVDTLNLKIPVYQFKMVGASHSYKLSHSNNIITWTFDDIYLKPKSVDEAGSKGYIILDAYINTELKVGDSIINMASIYFDYNEPIHTKNCVLKRVEDDSVNINDPHIYRSKLFAYPNPSVHGNDLKVVNNSKKQQTFIIYDLLGQKMFIGSLNQEETIAISIEHWSTGLYILQSSEGEVIKLIKN